MSDESTKTMIEGYNSDPPETAFLSSQFRVTRESFFDTESVEFDIMRSGRAVSVVIQDLSVANRVIAAETFTNKEFVPPIHGEEFSVNSYDLLKRQFGVNPFASPNFRANLVTKILRSAKLIEGNIARSNEWQSSQVLQTGKVVLTDSSGNPVFEIDYKPKATHFFSSAIAWDTGGATILADMETAGDLNLKDGNMNSNQAIMGDASWNAFIADPDIREQLDNRRKTLGALTFENRGGATFKGNIVAGNYNFDIWTYSGSFDDPQTGTDTRFVTPSSCIIRPADARMDAVFGGIPNIAQLLGQAPLLTDLPTEIRRDGAPLGLHLNSWLEPGNRQVKASVQSRPLFIPTAIDTITNINTGT